MADNVPITAGTGTTIATDDAGAGGHVQIVKLALSTDGSASPIPADASGLAVQGSAAHDAAVAGNPTVVGGRSSAAAPSDVSGDGDAVRAWFLRNGAQATVLTAAGELIGGDATNGVDVDVTRLPSGTVAGSSSLPAGVNLIGQVTSLGGAAHDAAVSGNPVLAAGYASAAAPSDVSGDGDAVRAWFLRNGAAATVLTAAGALIGGDATNGLDVDVTRLPALAAGTNNIGDVDVLTLPALPAGTNAIGKLAANSGVDIGDVDVTSLTGGTIAHDGIDSGNPIKVGARAAATLGDDTMVADADRTDLVTDLDAALLVRPGVPLGDRISERVTNTDGASTAFTNFGATASTRNHVDAIVVYNSSPTAATVDFRDGTAGAVLWTMPIPAGGGSIIALPGQSLFKTTANTALAFDVSGALTTVTISISGFKSKVV